MLVLRRSVEPGQYLALRDTERLAEAGVEPSSAALTLSPSKDGDSDDDALAETINGLPKAEVIHRRGPWRSFEAVEFATLEWADRFDTRRLFEPIGNLPPEAEARHCAQAAVRALAA